LSGIEVEIIFGNKILSENSRRLRNHQWDNLVKNLVINPEDIVAGDLRFPAKDEDGAEYLIITHDTFLESCQELVGFRTQQGILTTAVPLSLTGSSADDIEAYINQACNNWVIPPISILLVGDMELLPGPVWQNYSVSDNIYADVNEDGLPDVFISRIPVQTISEFENILQKIIAHETNPPLEPDYYNHPLSCSDHSNNFGYGWMVSEILNGWYQQEFGKEPNRQYSGMNPGPANWPNPDLYQVFGPDGLCYIPESPEYLGNYIGGNTQGINAGLNSGAMSLFSYTHGNSIGWQPPVYTIPDLSGLTDAQPTYLFAINSMNGKYNSPTDCIAEAFLKHPHGGLGVIAPTDVIYANGPEWYTIGVIDGLWDDFYPANNPTHLYDFIYPCMANTSAKYFLEFLPYPIAPNMKSIVYNLFHYFGEPYSVMYDQVPQELTVDHPPSVMGGEIQFPVTANQGATIALVVNGEIFSVLTATGEQMLIPVSGLVDGDTLLVTVTKHNYIRYHAEVSCYNWIGMEENTNADLVKIFPNPAEDNVCVLFPGRFKLTVFNNAGKLILQNNGFKGQANLAVEEWPAGIYYIFIDAGGKHETSKIVVK
jgi:hypothetical protein